MREAALIPVGADAFGIVGAEFSFREVRHDAELGLGVGESAIDSFVAFTLY